MVFSSENRLSTMSGSGGNCTGLSWSYDAWGNRTAQTPTGGTCNQSNLTFDANNRITTSGFTYDADGNVTYDGVHHYYYDAENRLIQTDGTPGTCSTAAACYFYDTQGRRVQKIIGSGETSYLFDLSGHIVAEDYGTGWGPGYVYAGGQLIAEYENSTTYFVHDNNIGTSTILSNMAGGINPGDCNALYPFGEQDNTICSTSNLTSHKFTGKERDTESNLDNFGARYYSSAQGRFLTADWSAIPAPVPYANLSDPQTLNLYAYVGNNPLGRVDPDGHQQASTGTTQCGNAQCPDTAGAAAATGADKKGPQNVLVLKVGAGGEIGAEAKFGPATAKLSASAGVEADVPNQSANASVKMNADIKLGPAQLGGEAKLGLVSADENGLHAEFKPSASIGIGGERKAFGTGADHDTDEGFVASGTIKAGVVKVEIGVNLTALGNRISDAGHAVMQFLGSPVKGLDFSGEVPRFAPPGP